MSLPIFTPAARAQLPAWMHRFEEAIAGQPAYTAARALLPYGMIDDFADPTALLEALPGFLQDWHRANPRRGRETGTTYASRLRVALKEFAREEACRG